MTHIYILAESQKEAQDLALRHYGIQCQYVSLFKNGKHGAAFYEFTNPDEKDMRAVYFTVFGKEFDDPNRKQLALPLSLAYLVALNALDSNKNN